MRGGAIRSLGMTTVTYAGDAEAVIRKYLLFLDDPSKLRDEAEIEQKNKAVEAADDPIERLKAIADLKRVSEVDEAPLRAGFVEHAKAWADEVGVPVAAFQEMKVPDDVLLEAGFDVVAQRRRGRGAAVGEGRQRAKSVSTDEIKTWVLDHADTFTLADVMNGIGGSPATVRKAVEELVEAGRVDKLGPVPAWHGRGRAPVQYKRS